MALTHCSKRKADWFYVRKSRMQKYVVLPHLHITRAAISWDQYVTEYLASCSRIHLMPSRDNSRLTFVDSVVCKYRFAQRNRDVVPFMNELRRAFKQCENPYRRGVVSVSQFQVNTRFLILFITGLQTEPAGLREFLKSPLCQLVSTLQMYSATLCTASTPVCINCILEV